MRIQANSSSTAWTNASRRAAYSLAAGAAAGIAAEARAVVVYSGIEDFNIEQRNYLPLGLDDDGVTDIYLRNYINPYVGLTGNFQGAFLNWAPGRLVAKRVGNLNYVRALDSGFMVDASSVNPNSFVGSMAFGSNHPNAEFNTADDKYVGFSFAHFPSPPPLPVDQRELHFAWVRVSINNAAGTFVVRDWAYESETNVGIVTGNKGAAGDFNDDGVVDAADYTVWRDNLGSDNILGGHGDENGASLNVVDKDDYNIWKANFGYTAPSPPAAAVPEPGTLGILAAGALGLGLLRRRRE
ncbi:MAG: PEP-CTERM sorting domain-containing protein [Pirellulales bacterium]